ncbi:MAG: hypothetical protein MSIBF_02880 [Candidatus Altiarchaeales archaeon IMC4]|nr:MAG: hypothetical protein MSIBF_02880 [Candidatus Altiarchaeales archaeon IMC4]
MKILRYGGNGQVEVIEADKISIGELKDSWLDLTGDLPENLFGIKFEKIILNEDEYSQIEDGPDYTLVKIGYVGRENHHKTIYAMLTEDAIITTHKEECTPINRFIKNMKAIVKDEKENIKRFNDFVIAQIFYQIENENMNAVSNIGDSLETLRKKGTSVNLEDIDKARGDIRTFSRTILYQSIIVSEMKRGEGEFINKGNLYEYCVDVENELVKYSKLVTGLEKELNGIIESLETRELSEYTRQTARLNIAIEILTRASVLLMIPNSIFTLWPSIFRPDDLVFGMRNFYLELLVATVSIIISQIAMSSVYKKIKTV